MLLAGVICSKHELVEDISDSNPNSHFWSCEKHMRNNGLGEKRLILAHSFRGVSPWPLDFIGGKAEHHHGDRAYDRQLFTSWQLKNRE